MATGDQISWRLTDDERAVIAAVAFLKGMTPTDVARDLVSQFLRAEASRPRVQQAVRLRAEEAADSEGRLRALNEHRGERRRSGTRRS